MSSYISVYDNIYMYVWHDYVRAFVLCVCTPVWKACCLLNYFPLGVPVVLVNNFLFPFSFFVTA